MPTSAKIFKLHDEPKLNGRVLGKHNYGRAWERFRKWYAEQVIPVCVDCKASHESKRMHLDHDPPLTGPDDEGMYDETRVKWRCVSCHSRKTAIENGLGER